MPAAAALEAASAAPALTPAARKALTQFDTLGRLVRWPHKFSVQRLLEVTPDQIQRRVADFHRLVNFEQELS
jgi:hypothetical protein